MNKVEKHCIKTATKGDIKSFEYLVNQHKSMVYTLALRMLNNIEEAEELTQDVFVQMFKTLDKFKYKSKFSTWIYRITYNLSINKIKSLNRNRTNNTVDFEQLYMTDHKSDSLFSLHEQEQKKIIHQALAKLPDEDRFIISLYYFDDLSLKEIAEVVNLKIGNIKIKLYRSRAFLHKLLKNKVSNEIISSYE